MQNHLMYEMQHQDQGICGILLRLEYTDDLIAKIKPHEEICPHKMKRYYEQFLQGASQHTPLMLGIIPDHFETLLNISKTSSQPFKINSDEKLWISHDQKNAALSDFLQQLPELLLIDGHHRFHALKALQKEIFVWIVPFYKLMIKSFIKVFNHSKPAQILEKLKHHFVISSNDSLEIDPSHQQINLYLKDNFFKIQLNQEYSFTNVLCHLHTILSQENLALTYCCEYQANRLRELTHLYEKEHLIVTHTSFQHAEIMASSLLLPTHSTYFMPKPTNESLQLCLTKKFFKAA